jgi:peroxiredoxin (alkyl hydroperoxide reductase subunit C)
MYYPQEVGRNMDEVLRAVRVLQIADDQGAVPAGWPNNELIGNRVIVPPPSNVTDAEKRLGEYECFDWWFCHKPLE